MTRTNPIKDGLTEPDKNRKMHKEKQTILVNDKSQKEKTSTTTNEMQEPAKDPMAEAAKADDKNIQRPVQQWVKKEGCLKEEEKGSSLGSKPQKPQAQAKPPTQATKDNEETYVPPARINMCI